MVVAWATEGWNLVAGDTNNAIDIFVHDRATGTTERVSVDSSGNQVWGGSSGTALSADGEIVAFGSVATDLVAGDTNGNADIFIHDRRNGITQRVSVDSTGAQGDRDSGEEYTTVVAISGDGRVVAFFSSATNLVAGDTNALDDIFVHEIDLVDASWTNYGTGFAGALGVPAFTSQTDPLGRLSRPHFWRLLAGSALPRIAADVDPLGLGRRPARVADADTDHRAAAERRLVHRSDPGRRELLRRHPRSPGDRARSRRVARRVVHCGIGAHAGALNGAARVPSPRRHDERRIDRLDGDRLVDPALEADAERGSAVGQPDAARHE
jgi:hypothetical protein